MSITFAQFQNPILSLTSQERRSSTSKVKRSKPKEGVILRSDSIVIGLNPPDAQRMTFLLVSREVVEHLRNINVSLRRLDERVCWSSIILLRRAGFQLGLDWK